MYHIVVIIVLINMLIAMMARSYEVIAVGYSRVHVSSSVWCSRVLDLCNSITCKIKKTSAFVLWVGLDSDKGRICSNSKVSFLLQSNSDLEWKYARTKLRMRYFSEVGSLPPPFNIMLIGQAMKSMSSCANKCCCGCCNDLADGFKPDPDAYKKVRAVVWWWRKTWENRG